MALLQQLEVMSDPILGGPRLAVFARHTDGRNWGDWYDPTPEAMCKLTRLNEADFNIYWHINQSDHRLPAIRASRSTIRSWRNVLIDLDPLDGFILGEEDLREFDWANTAIHSGRGWQLIQHLTQPVAVTAVNAQQIEVACHKYLQFLSQKHNCKRFKVDTTTFDLARIARLPPFKNTKSGRRAFIFRHGTNSLDPAEVMRYCPIPPEPLPLQQVVLPEVIDRAWLLSHLSLTGAKFVFEGADYPSRHHCCFVAARDLSDLGVCASDALAILAIGSALCRPQPLGIRDLQTIIQGTHRHRF